MRSGAKFATKEDMNSRRDDAMPTLKPIQQRQIRASYDDQVIRVYQAYCDEIADIALAKGTFVSPSFKMERTTWIKPSFLWMMYRSGWARKDQGQSRILAIDIGREGFQWALDHSCPTRSLPSMSTGAWELLKADSPVLIQWDPERDLHLRPLPYRTIQIGLTKKIVPRYLNQWIRAITDVTPLAHSIHDLVRNGEIGQACSKLPVERPYPQEFGQNPPDIIWAPEASNIC